MKSFNVITLGRFLVDFSIDVALSSYAEFYKGVSYKYQKKIKLILVDKSYNQFLNKEITEKLKITEAVEFVNLDEQDEVETAYRAGAILLLPRPIKSSSIITEAFSYGLPVLVYSGTGHDDIVDQSCGMKIDFQNEIQTIKEIAENLKLLMYDPEAVKLLKKGASNKYRIDFQWGRAQGAR